MDHSLKVGVSFGTTSGIITTLGLMIGLYSGTQSRLAVIGGIITIAVADSLSDALGIHIAEESEHIHSEREIWTSTVATFVIKGLVALSFLVPLYLFELKTGIIINSLWGMALLSVLSYAIAKSEHLKAFKVVGEHLAIGISVILLTHFLGLWINAFFK